MLLLWSMTSMIYLTTCLLLYLMVYLFTHLLLDLLRLIVYPYTLTASSSLALTVTVTSVMDLSLLEG